MASEATRCLHCDLRLVFGPSGWVHAHNGQYVITRDGRDDHVATPNRSAS